jgi:hypothetical protein
LSNQNISSGVVEDIRNGQSKSALRSSSSSSDVKPKSKSSKSWISWLFSPKKDSDSLEMQAPSLLAASGTLGAEDSDYADDTEEDADVSNDGVRAPPEVNQARRLLALLESTDKRWQQAWAELEAVLSRREMFTSAMERIETNYCLAVTTLTPSRANSLPVPALTRARSQDAAGMSPSRASVPSPQSASKGSHKRSHTNQMESVPERVFEVPEDEDAEVHGGVMLINLDLSQQSIPSYFTAGTDIPMTPSKSRDRDRDTYRDRNLSASPGGPVSSLPSSQSWSSALYSGGSSSSFRSPSKKTPSKINALSEIQENWNWEWF